MSNSAKFKKGKKRAYIAAKREAERETTAAEREELFRKLHPDFVVIIDDKEERLFDPFKSEKDFVKKLPPLFYRKKIVNVFQAMKDYFDAIKKNGYVLELARQVEDMGDPCLPYDEIEETFYESKWSFPPPPVRDLNPTLPYASKKVVSEKNDRNERFLKAVEPISVEEAIIIEPATILGNRPACQCNSSQLITIVRCHHCLTPLGVDAKVYYCGTCELVLFCTNSICVVKGQEYHQIECYGMERHFWGRDLEDQSYLAMRMMYYGLTSKIPIKDDRTDYLYISTASPEVPNTLYPCIVTLQTHFDKMTLTEVNLALHRVTRTLLYLIKRTKFFKELKKEFPIKTTTYNLYIFVGGLMLIHYCQALTNTVYFDLPNVAIGVLSEKIERRLQTICPTIARINHSCDPNAVLVVHNNIAVIKAIKAIRKDEQIFICYTEVFSPWSLNNRHAVVTELFHFYCYCEFCNISTIFGDRVFKCRECRVGRIKFLNADRQPKPNNVEEKEDAVENKSDKSKKSSSRSKSKKAPSTTDITDITENLKKKIELVSDNKHIDEEKFSVKILEDILNTNESLISKISLDVKALKNACLLEDTEEIRKRLANVGTSYDLQNKNVYTEDETDSPETEVASLNSCYAEKSLSEESTDTCSEESTDTCSENYDIMTLSDLVDWLENQENTECKCEDINKEESEEKKDCKVSPSCDKLHVGTHWDKKVESGCEDDSVKQYNQGNKTKANKKEINPTSSGIQLDVKSCVTQDFEETHKESQQPINECCSDVLTALNNLTICKLIEEKNDTNSETGIGSIVPLENTPGQNKDNEKTGVASDTLSEKQELNSQLSTSICNQTNETEDITEFIKHVSLNQEHSDNIDKDQAHEETEVEEVSSSFNKLQVKDDSNVIVEPVKQSYAKSFDQEKIIVIDLKKIDCESRLPKSDVYLNKVTALNNLNLVRNKDPTVHLKALICPNLGAKIDNLESTNDQDEHTKKRVIAKKSTSVLKVLSSTDVTCPSSKNNEGKEKLATTVNTKSTDDDDEQLVTTAGTTNATDDEESTERVRRHKKKKTRRAYLGFCCHCGVRIDLSYEIGLMKLVDYYKDKDDFITNEELLQLVLKISKACLHDESPELYVAYYNMYCYYANTEHLLKCVESLLVMIEMSFKRFGHYHFHVLTTFMAFFLSVIKCPYLRSAKEISMKDYSTLTKLAINFKVALRHAAIYAPIDKLQILLEHCEDFQNLLKACKKI